ncbi:hypothetical protein EYC80_005106 [Monilinia laxa]|uniref:Uncharacterized protein n=1 Tax=Monilinia laxa TaxID=61186 RepID=A0A5N6KIW0_MONLA|nr:hypothetical protein EYC80_005106 [Monilinia laxa]
MFFLQTNLPIRFDCHTNIFSHGSAILLINSLFDRLVFPLLYSVGIISSRALSSHHLTPPYQLTLNTLEIPCKYKYSKHRKNHLKKKRNETRRNETKRNETGGNNHHNKKNNKTKQINGKIFPP